MVHLFLFVALCSRRHPTDGENAYGTHVLSLPHVVFMNLPHNALGLRAHSQSVLFASKARSSCDNCGAFPTNIHVADERVARECCGEYASRRY